MSLNINAKLFSSKFQKPIDLRLTEGSNVEIDESARRTYFKGFKVTLYPQSINGILAYEDETEGWIPLEFDYSVDVIVDACISNDLLYREFILHGGTEIPVDGNSCWVEIREVVSQFYDRDTVKAKHKRDGILELFNMEGLDATLTISLSMSLAMW